MAEKCAHAPPQDDRGRGPPECTAEHTAEYKASPQPVLFISECPSLNAAAFHRGSTAGCARLFNVQRAGMMEGSMP